MGKSNTDTSAARASKSNYSDKATAAAHDAVDRFGEQAARTEERLRDAADDIQRRSSAARERAEGLGDDVSVRTRSYVQEHPLASLGVAFGVGVLLSALMRR